MFEPYPSRVSCVTASAFVAVIGTATAANAQSGNVVFDGLILSSCSVVPGLPGTLAATPDGATLTSKAGTPGTAAVTATGLGYEATVDAPTGFTLAPSGAETGTTFAVEYEASGATLLSTILAGVGIPLSLGTTTLTIDAEATRTGTIFPAGAYQLVTTVRCVSP